MFLDFTLYIEVDGNDPRQIPPSNIESACRVWSSGCSWVS